MISDNDTGVIQSNISDDWAFTERTHKLLKQYKRLIKAEKERGHKRVSYSRTLFLNCCIGMLFIPRERVYEDTSLNKPAKEWGINTSSFTDGYVTNEGISAKQLIRHLRNSIAHGHFKCIYNKQHVLISIIFEDHNHNGELSFYGKMSYKAFEKFVILLANYALESNKDRMQ